MVQVASPPFSPLFSISRRKESENANIKEKKEKRDEKK
jgi:hypothetical protein